VESGLPCKDSSLVHLPLNSSHDIKPSEVSDGPVASVRISNHFKLPFAFFAVDAAENRAVNISLNSLLLLLASFLVLRIVAFIEVSLLRVEAFLVQSPFSRFDVQERLAAIAQEVTSYLLDILGIFQIVLKCTELARHFLRTRNGCLRVFRHDELPAHL
jgi:hypothetical protein